MATMQIRNVPEDVHRVYRQRAAATGLSLQEYLLAEVSRTARRATPAEIVEEIEQQIRHEGPEGWSERSSVADIRADRDER